MRNRHINCRRGGRQMNETRRRGLSGKARRVRERNRAARLNAKRLIREYYEPEATDPLPGRYIPIRHTTAFRPTVAISRPTKAHRIPGKKAIVKAAPRTSKRDAGRQSAPTRGHSGAQPGKALRLSCTSQASYEATSARAAIFGRRRPFKLGGFLFGCALGTAAVSFLLICVRTAIG